MIAIDLGYSHVKAVSEDGRVLLPSVVSPPRELLLADLGKNIGYQVEIRRINGQSQQYFVGELAIREGLTPSFCLEREKHLHPHHDVLVLTAIRLVGGGTGVPVVVGLPPGYYNAQKDALTRHLMGLHAEVAINGGNPQRVSIGRVIVYPQGAGALLTVKDLPSYGLIILVDIGYKTTDFIGAEMVDGAWRVVSSLCGTIEIAVHALHEAVAQEIRKATGAQLDPTRMATLLETGTLWFRGQEYDLTPIISRARAGVAQAIADRVLTTLGDRGDFVRRTYLAGGGAAALPELAGMLPGAEVVPEAQWANALGYLEAGRQLIAQAGAQ